MAGGRTSHLPTDRSGVVLPMTANGRTRVSAPANQQGEHQHPQMNRNLNLQLQQVAMPASNQIWTAIQAAAIMHLPEPQCVTFIHGKG